MQRKAMISVVVAGTLGLTAAAFAGTGHEVATPFSPNESGENVLLLQQHQSLGTGFSSSTESIGSTASRAEGSVGGSHWGSSHSESSSSSGSSMELRTDGSWDHSSSLPQDDTVVGSDRSWGSEESLASTGAGSHGDYYVVTLTPVVVEQWDLYVIDDGSSGELAP